LGFIYLQKKIRVLRDDSLQSFSLHIPTYTLDAVKGKVYTYMFEYV